MSEISFDNPDELGQLLGEDKSSVVEQSHAEIVKQVQANQGQPCRE